MPNNKFPKLGLGSEVDASSKMLDLANTTLGTSIMQNLSLVLSDKALNSQLNYEFENLQKNIFECLSQKKAGYLIEVSLYSNEFGQIALPYGQLLLPIGIGLEPIDSYAEFLRSPQLRPRKNPISGLVNNSFFLWVKIGPDDNIEAWTIPSQYRSMLAKSSIEESNRRNKLSKWIQIFPDQQYSTISRSVYWQDIESSRIAMIDDLNKRNEISTLTTKMQFLETKANKLFHNYQEIAFDLAKKNSYAQMLTIATSIANIYNSAIELNRVIEKNSELPITGNSIEPPLTYKGTAEIIEQRRIQTKTYSEEIIRSLKIELTEIRHTDSLLHKKYKESDIVLPMRELKIPELP